MLGKTIPQSLPNAPREFKAKRPKSSAIAFADGEAGAKTDCHEPSLMPRTKA